MELTRLKIGLNNYLPVYIKDKDRYTSILLMGKSGSGKSALISGWWEQDCYFRTAKVLIEPSGFLAKDCYSISKGKALYCSLNNPVSINPMQTPYDPNQISDNIAEALNQVITITTPNDKLTVKMRGILDTAVKYCLAHSRNSLLHVRDYIQNLKGDGETRDGVIQRLNFLLNDDRMQPILCGNNSVEWGKLIQLGQSLILDAFGMSREKMIFAGNIISQGIKNYFRYERPTEYRPLAMYVDECHLFVNMNFMDILKEGRKYKLSCILATQDFATIDEKLARVMLNVGTIVTFRVGAREAGLIGRELLCPGAILQTLDKYVIAYKTPGDYGIAKTPRPPLFRKMEVSPERGQEPRRKSQWFTLEPYQC
ncbi:MAG: type IV secretory system conjugative DNA transfer family protein [Nitrospirae bacterium]|nr:type IV secretory system conjugative DNA transfer family protein [Nitrospirota bacterium]